jgi:hypothetical protein
MGMRGGARDSFVVVSYDFEYSTEEGKRVWMKEGEVLLLLAKTNNDWWQVGIVMPTLRFFTIEIFRFFAFVYKKNLTNVYFSL